MTEEILETYISISQNRYAIYIIDKNNFKKLYQNEININNDNLKYDYFIQFLDENIFKIEKSIGKFIKNIYLIIDSNEALNLNIGVKAKNFDHIINSNNLENILTETKDLYTKNYQDQKLMHMIINTYFINDNDYAALENTSKAKDLCLVVNFISIPKNLSNEIERILEKYQIKIKRYLHTKYIQDFFKKEEIHFPEMIYRIINGSNENEVQLVSKNHQNKGFFEKFFQLFS